MGAILGDCLRTDPAQRPSFTELDRRLATLDVGLLTSPVFVEEAGDAGSLSKARDALLMDRFPPHVAKALLAGEKVRLCAHALGPERYSAVPGLDVRSGQWPCQL